MSQLLARGPATAADRLSIRVTALCWFVVLLDGLDLFVYGAVLPGLLADEGFALTPAAAGLLGAVMVAMARRREPVRTDSQASTAATA